MSYGRTSAGIALLTWGMLLTQLTLAQELLPERNPQLFTQAVHILGGNRNLSVRWQNDIRYWVVSDGEPAATAFVHALFDELNTLTGIKSRPVENPASGVAGYLENLTASPRYTIADCSNLKDDSCPNFVIVITSQQTMHSIANTIPLRPVFQKATAAEEALFCFFSPGVTPQREIKQGFVFIDSSLDELMLQTCLQEEIYQSFGLFNDYTDSTFFSFDNLVQPKTITRYDRALLSSLYEPAFPAGTLVNRIALHMINSELEARQSLFAEAP